LIVSPPLAVPVEAAAVSLIVGLGVTLLPDTPPAAPVDVSTTAAVPVESAAG